MPPKISEDITSGGQSSGELGLENVQSQNSTLYTLHSRLKVVVTGTRGIPDVMGGVETHCEGLYPRIAAKGIDVTVIRRASYVEREERREEREESGAIKTWKGVKLVDIATPKKKSFEAIIHTFRAIRAAKRLGADIVHIHAIGPALLTPYAKMLGMKVVFTHHGPDYDRAKWGRAAKMMLRLGERMGCRYADEVIVISNVIKDLIARKHGRTEHVHLIYNGVPEAEVSDYPEYFEQLGIEPGRYILGMCRFVPEKNLHHLIEACSRIDMKGSRLVLAGDSDFDDEYSRGLKESARAHGVVLTGFIKGHRLHSLLSHCLCYCLPSSHEGLPIALLEAMSYGAPVVVSDIPANLEVGLPRENYFATGEIDELARKLQEIINTQPQHTAYDMSLYDWDNIAEQTADVYRSLSEE